MRVKYVSAEEFHKLVQYAEEVRAYYPFTTYNGYLPTRLEVTDQTGTYCIEIAPTKLMEALV